MGLCLPTAKMLRLKEKDGIFFVCFFYWSILIRILGILKQYQLLCYISIHVWKCGVVALAFLVVLFGFVNGELQMK